MNYYMNNITLRTHTAVLTHLTDSFHSNKWIQKQYHKCAIHIYIYDFEQNKLTHYKIYLHTLRNKKISYCFNWMLKWLTTELIVSNLTEMSEIILHNYNWHNKTEHVLTLYLLKIIAKPTLRIWQRGGGHF